MRTVWTAAAVAAGLAWGGMVFGEEECTDGFCPAPHFGGEGTFEVWVPVPESAVERIPAAPRLETLEGKTVALAGGSFMANVTHAELKRLILAEYPGAKVLLPGEIGSAGPYPRPGVKRREKEEFERKLRDWGVDAVVSGNGGCGLCTPKETGSCIAAEAMGVASVMIAGPGFADQARSTAAAAGLAALRVAEYPGAFASDTREELIENTRKVLWPQVKAGLLGGNGAADGPGGDGGENGAAETVGEGEGTGDKAAELLGPLTYGEVQEVFLDSGWTDGLPVTPPTEELVAEFLRFTDRDGEESLGAIPPGQREARVRHVAVNGAMAGCAPEWMPILLAFAEAMKEGEFRRTLASTHGWTPYVWLNGPVGRQLGFDCGQGEISAPKNAALGRFLQLAMRNLGGYREKENRMGTFGYLMPWCLMEDEAAAVEAGWKPWHLQQGFGMGESTLTAASAINWGNNLAPATADAGKIKDMMAWDAVEKSQMAVRSGMPCTYRVVLVTAGVARDLAGEYGSKAALERAVRAAARIPLGERAFANYWGNPGSAFDPRRYPVEAHAERVGESEGAERTETPPWLAWTGIGDMETVPAMAAGKTAFLVTGDRGRNKVLTLPGGGFATVKIELPEKWDELAEEKGYRPLGEFAIECDLEADEKTEGRRMRVPSHAGARGDRPGGGVRGAGAGESGAAAAGGGRESAASAERGRNGEIRRPGGAVREGTGYRGMGYRRGEGAREGGAERWGGGRRRGEPQGEGGVFRWRGRTEGDGSGEPLPLP